MAEAGSKESREQVVGIGDCRLRMAGLRKLGTKQCLLKGKQATDLSEHPDTTKRGLKSHCR